MVLRYNYTLNPWGVYEAIKYMYTFWPDPKNVTLIRDQYINVSICQIISPYRIEMIRQNVVDDNLGISVVNRLQLCRSIRQNRQTPGGEKSSSLSLRFEHNDRSSEFTALA